MCARDATGPTTVSSRSSRASDYAEARCREPARFPASGHELGIIRDPALWRLCRTRHKRHAFATHLLEAGRDVHTVQRLLGHRYVTSTVRYFHLSQGRVLATPSPLDLPEPPAA